MKTAKTKKPAQVNQVNEAEFQQWIDAKKAQYDLWRKQSDMGLLSDDENPAFLFSCTDSKMLAKIASGEISATFLATMELANRGLDKSGKWVGFDQARKIHGLK